MYVLYVYVYLFFFLEKCSTAAIHKQNWSFSHSLFRFVSFMFFTSFDLKHSDYTFSHDA